MADGMLRDDVRDGLLDESCGGVRNESVTGGDCWVDRFYLEGMYTIEVEAEELQLLRSALTSYLQAFGHNEADLVVAARGLLGKLPEPAAEAAAG